jgi:hypothetical protein
VDFRDYLRPRRATVQLGGRGVSVERAPLGRHFVLGAIAGSEDPLKPISYVAEATGLSVEEVGAAGFAEVLTAYWTLLALNRLDGEFPFMRDSGQKREPDPLDYPGRALAGIVHLIATAYHWDRDRILGLQPEEALFYSLEILAEQHRRKAWEYNLAQVGFDKQGHKIPFQHLNWYWPGQEPKPKVVRLHRERAIRAGAIPEGLVIDLAERYRNGRRAGTGN